MVKGVDDLIYFLLERISLCSGATCVEIEKYVHEFYSRSDDDSFWSRHDSLLAPVTTSSPGAATVDARLLSKVWQWLTENPDIRVEQRANHRLPPSVDSVLHNDRSKASASRTVPERNGLAASGANPAERQLQHSEAANQNEGLNETRPEESWAAGHLHDLVLVPTTEKVWQTITGHDVDLNRVPNLEFDLLSIIAAAGEAGIAQSTLTHLSKQDKRSVPKRTDALHRKGYIVKTALRLPGESTSRCTLRKLARPASEPQVPRPWLQMSPSEIHAVVFEASIFHKIRFLEAASAIIKEAGVITTEAFRLRINITTRCPQRQAADLWLYQMELVGCVQRVLAKGPKARRSEKTLEIKSLKFLKDPDQVAKDAYMKFYSKDRQSIWLESHSLTDQRADKQTQIGATQAASNDIDDEARVATIPLRWHPQQPIENQIYDLVSESGRKGISTMDLVRTLSGASYRALDTMLGLLTNVWHESQPAHLRHLAIIRDTVLRNGSLHFLYRTLSNFDLADKAGEASWQAIFDSQGSSGGPQEHEDPIVTDLDGWGFPDIPESQLTGCGNTKLPVKSRVSKKRGSKHATAGRSTSSIKNSNKRRKITENLNTLTPPPNGATSQTSKEPQANDKDALPKKVHIEFGAQMLKVAQRRIARLHSTLSGADTISQIGSRKRKRNRSDVPASPTSNPERETAADVTADESNFPSTKQLQDAALPAVRKMHQDLIFMSLPGLYVNPPQRLPITRGRPPKKKKILLVIKSDRLQDFAWFKDSPASERYYHDPSATFKPLIVGESSVEMPTTEFEDSFDAHEPRFTNGSPANPLNAALDFDYTSERDATETIAGSERILQSTQDDSMVPGFHNRTSADKLTDETFTQDAAKQTPSPNREQRVDRGPTVSRSNPPNSQHNTLRYSTNWRDNRHRAGVRLVGGSQERQRGEMLMQIINHAGGLYPGPKELWYPFVTALQKTDETVRPDSGTIERAVMNLVKSGKLKRLQFAFKGKSGGHVNRSIIALPEFDKDSEAVKNLEQKIIANSPAHYLPDEVEVDRSLTLQHINRKMAEEKMIPKRNLGYIPAPDIEVELAAKQSTPRRKRATVPTRELPPRKRRATSPTLWGPEDDDEVEVDEAQQGLQSVFSVEGYSHQPDAMTRFNNPAGGRKLGKLIKFNRPAKDEVPAKDELPINEADTSNERLSNYDPRLLDNNTSSIEQEAAVASHGRRLTFVSSKETAAAAQQEALREQQALRDAMVGATSEISIRDSPVAWIMAWSTMYPAIPRSRLRLAVTLTDPDQQFNSYSGTFSTAFAVIRDIRPKLKIQPNLQRDFEDRVPHSLGDMIEQFRMRSHPGPRSKRKRGNTFDEVIDEVKMWEQRYSQMLTSHGALITPRFINHTVTQESDLAGLESPSSPEDTQSGMGRTSLRDISEEVGAHKSNAGPNAAAATETLETIGEYVAVTPSTRSSTVEAGPSTAPIPIKPILQSYAGEELTADQTKHLITAAIIVRCLLGGTQLRFKWPIVEQFCPGFSKHRWNKLLREQERYVQNLEIEFQGKFAEAYEKGEIDAPDPEYVVGYDWHATIDWALEHLSYDPAGVPEDPQNLELSTDDEEPSLMVDSATHQTFDQLFTLLEVETGHYEKSINDYLSSGLTIIKRRQVIGDLSFEVPLQILGASTSAARPGLDAGYDEVVKSYVRANVFTPELDYDPDRARARLVPFGDDALDVAIKTLQKSKIVKQHNKGRPAPGRNFTILKTFYDAFKPLWTFNIFEEAAKCTHWLDEQFETEGYAELSQHASQGDILALMNLHASKRIDIKTVLPPVTTDPAQNTSDGPSTKQTISIWGFTEGDYKSKYIHSGNFIFPVRVTPTASWDEGISLPSVVDWSPPAPHLGPVSVDRSRKREQRIPIWYDIHDHLIPDMWELVIAAIANAIALAPGVSAKGIVLVCKKMIDEWEVQLALEWMEAVGVAKRTIGRGDRFTTRSSWWWYILGQSTADGL